MASADIVIKFDFTEARAQLQQLCEALDRIGHDVVPRNEHDEGECDYNADDHAKFHVSEPERKPFHVVLGDLIREYADELVNGPDDGIRIDGVDIGRCTFWADVYWYDPGD